MRPIRKLISNLTLTGLLCSSISAYASDFDLRLAHFMPATSWQQEQIFNAWKKSVEEDSNGQISVSIYPGQTLGKAASGYDNAINGVADISWTVQGYTAGRFPLSQIMELPGLFETGAVGSCAFQKLFNSGALDDEYKETKVLYVHTHSPGHLHTRDKVVTSLDDLKGLRIRRPTTLIGDLLEGLGAQPVGMPAPEIYQSVQRGVIDGYMLPWETIQSFQTFDVTKQHLEFGFYSLAFVTTMNKEAYDGLPDNLKAVIDKNSGMQWAVNAGRGYDEADKKALVKIRQKGGQVNTLEDSEREAWLSVANEVSRQYIASLDEKGLPGTETYELVQEIGRAHV